MRAPPLLALTLLVACRSSSPPTPVAPSLAAFGEELRREVLAVAPGVHLALGYGLASSILLEGTDGVVVVDTLESVDAARPVKAAFDRIARGRPVKAILYTHNHPDHVFGASVFAEGAHPEVIAHRRTVDELDRLLSVIRPAIYRRSMRQFGSLLPPSEVPNAGIGPRLAYHDRQRVGALRPTRVFTGERLALELAGLKLELRLAPGETDDQIFVWLPEKRVLLCGDNFYHSFPNLYTIRGTSYRDPLAWVASLDAMRALRPRVLVPSHTRPIVGEREVLATLTRYRDAIQYVHDQTVRGMNLGLGPDELAGRVRLPEELARLPYLAERYGTVAWSVRGIYAGYLGWFDGNATQLFPQPPRARARRLARLAGGAGVLLREGRRALDEGDPQWAAELADAVLLLDPGSGPARAIRASALRALAARQENANARSYYLSQALETEGRLRIGAPRTTQPEVVRSVPLEAIFRAMTVSLDPARAAGLDRKVAFRFPDAGESYTLHVRNRVAALSRGEDADVEVVAEVNANVWKELVAGLRSPLFTFLSGEVKVRRGSLVALLGVLRLFRPD